LQDEYEETRLAKAVSIHQTGHSPVYGDRYLKYGVQLALYTTPTTAAGNQPLSGIKKSSL